MSITTGKEARKKAGTRADIKRRTRLSRVGRGVGYIFRRGGDK